MYVLPEPSLSLRCAQYWVIDIKPVGLGLGGNTGTKYPTSISWALNKVIVILQLWGILKGQELDPQCNIKALRVGIKSKA